MDEKVNKESRQNDTSPHSSQSGNRLAKIAEVVNFVVDYPDWEFTPVCAFALLQRSFAKGPPILSGLRACAKVIIDDGTIIIRTNECQVPQLSKLHIQSI